MSDLAFVEAALRSLEALINACSNFDLTDNEKPHDPAASVERLRAVGERAHDFAWFASPQLDDLARRYLQSGPGEWGKQLYDAALSIPSRPALDRPEGIDPYRTALRKRHYHLGSLAQLLKNDLSARLDSDVQSIFEAAEAARAEAVTTEAQRSEWHGRIRDAAATWEELAASNGGCLWSNSPDGGGWTVTGPALQAHVAALLRLGGVLAEGGWKAQVDTLAVKEPARKLAVAVLQKAIMRDEAGVTALVKRYVGLPFQLGFDVENLLRHSLMYEVLPIKRPAKKVEPEGRLVADEDGADGGSAGTGGDEGAGASGDEGSATDRGGAGLGEGEASECSGYITLEGVEVVRVGEVMGTIFHPHPLPGQTEAEHRQEHLRLVRISIEQWRAQLAESNVSAKEATRLSYLADAYAHELWPDSERLDDRRTLIRDDARVLVEGIRERILRELQTIATAGRAASQDGEGQSEGAGAGSTSDQGGAEQADGAGTDNAADQAGAEQGEGDNEEELSDRQRSILETMLEQEITSERRRITCAAIVRLINRNHKASSYARAFAGLVRRGLLQSREGAGGGVWVTPQRKPEVQRLLTSN